MIFEKLKKNLNYWTFCIEKMITLVKGIRLNHNLQQYEQTAEAADSAKPVNSFIQSMMELLFCLPTPLYYDSTK